MFPNSSIAKDLERYRWLAVLWTFAALFAVTSNALLLTHVVFGVVFFLLAATLVTVASISCAYVIARDSM